MKNKNVLEYIKRDSVFQMQAQGKKPLLNIEFTPTMHIITVLGLGNTEKIK